MAVLLGERGKSRWKIPHELVRHTLLATCTIHVRLAMFRKPGGNEEIVQVGPGNLFGFRACDD